MTYNDGAGSTTTPMPDSPPDLSSSKSSKSSKSSSFRSSCQSDDTSIIDDTCNFEDIGLEDESRAEAEIGVFETKPSSNPYDASFASDLRSSAKQRKHLPKSATHGNRTQRELTAGKKSPYPSLTNQIRNATAADGLGLLPVGGGRRGATSPILPTLRRNRSSSPNIPRHNNLSAISLNGRRGSWQSNRERKSVKELEKECDEDDGDDLPDDVYLQNIPISPRHLSERTTSTPASTSTSPDRGTKERVRSIGNGTSPRPAEQGVLRSPNLPGIARAASMGQFPIHDYPKGRAKSWTAALSELSDETKALTEALEAHAEDSRHRSFNSTRPEKQRVKSAIAELPPLRRTDILIDPLPISKEKEAVLSRTRPSWLPPKNPAEEKKHLREYQQMMAQSLEADRRREAEKTTQSTCRDDTANSLLRIWEQHVLPNWDNVMLNKRTRELWWRGVAPRSRGEVWQKAIGNELELSDSSYNAALRRAQALEKTIASGSQLSRDEERKKRWLNKITTDVQQTYPDLKIFQPDGPLHGALLDVLKAYAMYRSDVGYVHGTSTIAAILLLNLSTPSASFQALSNLLNRPLPLSFHTFDAGATSRVYSLLFSTLKLKSPRLHQHLTQLDVHIDASFQDIFCGLFTECLNLDNATRLWDVMVFEGDAIAVRAGVAYLTLLEGKLFGAESSKEVHEIIKGGLDNLGEEEWMRSVKDAGKS